MDVAMSVAASETPNRTDDHDDGKDARAARNAAVKNLGIGFPQK
jgi:hypothetical protein